MKRFESILASTQLDQRGEMFSRSSLESAAALLKRHYLTLGIEHDPRIAPVGRVIDAWVEDLPDGSSLLRSVGELFEPEDQLPPQIDRTIVERTYEAGRLQVVFDRTYENQEDIAEINDIAERFGSKPRFEGKKALDPLSVPLIGGSFVLGKIASGFFKEIGSDSYKWLKTKLSGLIERQRSKSKEQLLVFAFTVNRNGGSVLVQTILTNPKAEDIENFLRNTIHGS